MKKTEVCKCFQIPMCELEQIEQSNLLCDISIKEGELDFQDDDIQTLSDIMTLKQIGLSLEQIKHYQELEKGGEKTCKQRMNILNQQRNQLLDLIHEKQKHLDCLDYLLYELKMMK